MVAIGFGTYLLELDGIVIKIYRDEVVPKDENCTNGGDDCLFEVTDVKGRGFPNPKMIKDDQQDFSFIDWSIDTDPLYDYFYFTRKWETGDSKDETLRFNTS